MFKVSALVEIRDSVVDLVIVPFSLLIGGLFIVFVVLFLDFFSWGNCMSLIG